MSGSLHSRTSSTPICSGIFSKCFPSRGFKIKWLYLIFSFRPSRLSFWNLDIFLGKKGEISKVLLDRVGIDTIWVSDLKSDKIKWRLKNIVLKDFFFLHIHLSLQSRTHVRLFGTPWTATRQASLAITNSQNLLKLMSIESVMPFSRLILCRPLFLLPPIPPSISVFSNESTLHMRWPKY